MFTHLHVHSEFSLLDGMCRIPLLVNRAKELGMTSLAITDHGAMYGALDFYQAAKAAGIKPIVGCELYVAPNQRSGRTAADKSSYHVVLLAKNSTGYRNLLQLTSKAHLEGFYYKPKVDHELLALHHEGLVALTACMGGEIPSLILQNQLEEARQRADWYKHTFADFYLEIQRFPIAELEKINRELIAIGRELDIPLVATNDVHYILKEDAATHDILLCIGTNSTVSDEKRMKTAGDYFYLRSEEEMRALFQDLPDALENSQKIGEMCDLKLDFTRLHLPEIELPPGKSAQQYLNDLCWEGLPAHYPNLTSEIEGRLKYELEVIEKTQFANYFLVVWDMLSFARKRNILVGVRGSAAASIVLHCLGITPIDPLEHKLVFERFLNIERKEMPDIDSDFEDYRRQEVIDYVCNKYGNDHVAQIITFGTLGARAAIRDVGRALGMALSDVDRIARLIPFGVGMTLDKALEENAELRTIYDADSVIRKLVDSARKVEGLSRHASTHAAGIVISKEPLTRYVPLQQVTRSQGDGSGLVMTQYSMDNIAKIGLLKMDFLGLANLTILGKARDIIRESRGLELDLYKLPMEDQKTFALLSSGETTGVFQLESAGMRRYIKELKPSCFSDISAMVALYRPGPMEHIPTFIKSKKGEIPISYPHPALEKILEETYGVIVYQDQVLFIVREFAGYSLGQADIFRKAMGKKIPEVMQKEKVNFIRGAEKLGYSEEVASTIFALIEPFAGYAFNKAHSVSYALIAYQTAYLKANYPSEYMTAFLMGNAGVLDKISLAINECRRLGISVLPPDVNKSQAQFSIEDNGNKEKPAIRFGLASIKNVGNGVESLIREREKNGPFKSVEDLCRRLDQQSANRRVLESLIKAGALDSLGDRGALLASLDRLISLAIAEQKLKASGQSTMFDLFGHATPVPMPSLELSAGQSSPKERLAWERELMGVYLSEHPFAQYARKIDSQTVTLCGQITPELEGQNVSLVGMVASLREIFTREHKPFCSAMVEDLEASVEVMVWPRVYENTRDLWQEGNVLQIEGKVKVKEERVQVTCDSAGYFKPAESSGGKAVGLVRAVPVQNGGNGKNGNGHGRTEVAGARVAAAAQQRYRLILTLKEGEDESRDEAFLSQLIDFLKDNRGKDEVYLRIVNHEKVTLLKLANTFADYSPDLKKKLVQLLGAENLVIEKLENGLKADEPVKN
jgi:DNA polymerase-3 subunit alpha